MGDATNNMFSNFARFSTRGAVAAAGFTTALLAPQADMHCQVPCGIFNDPARVAQLKEDATTIRKAMVQVQAAHTQDSLQSVNQTTRWIMTKEDHACKIITLVGEYMLCQRVKPELFKNKEDYPQALQMHHELMVAAMKTKQTLDTAACDTLDHAIAHLEALYIKH